ncbi:hypothetical protein [Sphingobacterium pedocola]|uniref:DUF4890 domain-containing protein n=1 Tax=Sphingobacterium pedocola TaxID=2082722 RepID=A0ABR9T9Y7_9SPHI|nr:hypothetical protein [Sphingobacterium pedocola]MBE8721447.1 hypothetical protein [Sphingobacterium pedocola]
MKKLILTGLSFLFAITLTFAQQGTAEEKAKETVTTLTEKLTLTEEQQASVYNIVLEKATAKYALKADTTLSEDAVKEQISTLTSTADAKITELLTDEQKAEFAKYVEERNAKKEEQPSPIQPVQ